MAAISVVIATYNRAPLLRAAIHQLRKQQFLPGDEVIIVDNGSTDDTANVLASATRELPVTLRVLNESVKGKGPALAAGLAAATGDILALTDDDVLVADDWIGRIRRVFSDPVIALVGGRVDPTGKPHLRSGSACRRRTATAPWHLHWRYCITGTHRNSGRERRSARIWPFDAPCSKPLAASDLISLGDRDRSSVSKTRNSATACSVLAIDVSTVLVSV